MKTPTPTDSLAAAGRVMEVLDSLIAKGHLERFAHQHPAQFYQFATRVLPYYLEYKKALLQTAGNVRQRAFVRLSDGTEVDF